jgi:predicted RNA-binding protein with PIN domain
MTKAELMKALEQYNDNEDIKISIVFDDSYKMLANIEDISPESYAISNWVELKGTKIKVLPIKR